MSIELVSQLLKDCKPVTEEYEAPASVPQAPVRLTEECCSLSLVLMLPTRRAVPEVD